MVRQNRPVGRQKRIGTGSAHVKRRGPGLGRTPSSPVGGSGGLFNSSSRPTSHNQPSSQSSYPSSPRRNTRSSNKMLLLLLVLLVFFVFSKMGGGEGSIPTPGPSSANPLNSSTQAVYDGGAYDVDRTVASTARPKGTLLLGEGKDKVTVMVYLLGTDLESRSGMATMDLQEMLAAELSEKVNIVIETGGTTQWKNEVISSRSNQRYLINDQGLSRLESNLGRKSMVESSTLTEFIRYAKEHYPAERYFLILWDHGGGSVTGYGYDEYDKGNTMTLDEIERALFNADCHFDLVGFDACLMATLETAFVTEPYADYLIASEELEPGIGWYYTGWLNELSRNSSIETIDLGKKLIDDYISEVKIKTPKSQATLSLIDLAELGGSVPESFSRFSRSTGELIETEQYKTVSDSRANTKEFAASSRINQIDLIDFAKKLGTESALYFADSLGSAIKYNRMSDNITNAHGLSIYFPYGKLNDLTSMLETYEQIGMDEDYAKAIRSFANLNAGGQMANQGGSLLEMLLGSGQSTPPPSQGISSEVIGMLLNSFLSQGDFSSITGTSQAAPQWLDAQQISQSTNYYSQNMLDPASIVITEKGGQPVLDLTEDEWGLVQNIELSVFVKDGNGYIDLGRDNVFQYNQEGDLLLTFDGTWLAINDQVVSYYLTNFDSHGDNYKILGRVPALLNSQRVDLILSFDQNNPYGEVLGARLIYDKETETPNFPKGLLEIQPGDRIDFLCDYYSLQGQYDDSYYLGDPYYATGEWYIENLSLTNLDYLTSYKITDIYGNNHWTPALTQ